MRLPWRTVAAVCFFLGFPSFAQAQDVRVSNMNCDFNFTRIHVVSLAHAIGLIEQAGFPKQWRVIVACNERDWERIKHGRKLSPYHARTAFTLLDKKTTVVNVAIFDAVYMTDSPVTVLHHEVGHIRCQCSDEAEADRQGHTHTSVGHSSTQKRR